jgi:hypothetical protein
MLKSDTTWWALKCAYVQEHPGGQTGGQVEEELLLFPGVIMEILPKTCEVFLLLHFGHSTLSPFSFSDSVAKISNLLLQSKQ